MRLVVAQELPSIPSEEVAFLGHASWAAETPRGEPELDEGPGTFKKQNKEASLEGNKRKQGTK